MADPDSVPWVEARGPPAASGLPRRLARRAFEGFAHRFFRHYAPLCTEGREHLPEGPFILCSNHASHADSVVLMLAVGLPFSAFRLLAARDYFFASRVKRTVVDALVPILPIDRRPSATGMIDAISQCRAFFRGGGRALIIYPEGTRSVDGRIGSFKRGAALFALELGVPIVPACIEGAADVLPKGAHWPSAAPVRVHFATPALPPGALPPRAAGLAERRHPRVGAAHTHPEGRASMPADITHMKWWGWGEEGVEFDADHHPDLWPFIRRRLSLPDEVPVRRPVPVNTVALPEPRGNPAFTAGVESRLGTGRLLTDRRERLVHAYGKSYRDLWRARRGIVDFAPDAVVYPENEREVVALLGAAHVHDVVVVPFGGGTNIAGCNEVRRDDGRMVVTMDMRRMDAVAAIDDVSGTARIQAGATGPRLEEQLGAAGWTLGHLPDSFLYSTLGGWLATRSSGMQSDGYGNVEDMLVALRMVTPIGTIETRPVPHASTGIDVARLCVGSEGTLGVITEAVMRVRPVPARKDFFGYLFPSFAQGVEALRTCVREGCAPAMSRLNDPEKTALSAAYKPRAGVTSRAGAQLVKAYLSRIRGFDLAQSCVLLTAFEGTPQQFRESRRRAEAVYRRFGGVALGTGPGRAFAASKYEFPHLRDWAMDRGIMCDVSETATAWSDVLPLYEAVRADVLNAIHDTGVPGWIGCHLSHGYHDGASVYFTYGCVELQGREMEQYLHVKRAAEESFLRNGGTLSHHHAVGYEHLPWLAQDVSPHGIAAVQALKAALDPRSIMNPGKLVGDFSLAEWGLKPS